MRWAAGRQTTRVEDIAYCLLGLFDVNMTPQYGEGKKAFIRLQKEILSQDDDQALFAWHVNKNDVGSPETLFGLLADCPDRFLEIGSTELVTPKSIGGQPVTVTPRAINIELFLIPCHDKGRADFLAILDCEITKTESRQAPAVYLKRHWGTGDQYSKVLPSEHVYVRRQNSLEGGASWQRIFVKAEPRSKAAILRIVPSKDNSGLRSHDEGTACEWEVIEAKPAICWGEQAGTFEVETCKVRFGEPIGFFKINIILKEGLVFVEVAVSLKFNSERSCRSRCQVISVSQHFLDLQDGKHHGFIQLSANMRDYHSSEFNNALSHDRVGDKIPVFIQLTEHHHGQSETVSLHVLCR